jgi:acetoin utilization deacetylase AcuC-like enzyme
MRDSSPTSALARQALLVDEPLFDRHEPIGHHPERPQRLGAARSALTPASGTPGAAGAQTFVKIAPRPATDEELARVHDPRFVDGLAKLQGRSGYIDPDTYVSPESFIVARTAAGSLVAMVDALLDGPVSKGVALLRPPGHHARPAQAMGFCLLNNVAVAAAHARARGLERVAVVDWDVHHGNGTQEMFEGDPHVLYVSTHQFPFYPGTGDADETGVSDGRGYTVNIPLAAGGGDAVYAAAFERVVLPVLEEFSPQLVLVSAGFDAAAADPLAQMELSSDAFGWMASRLAEIAARSAEGRMALVLEGGYDLVALEAGLRSAAAGMLSGFADPIDRAVDDPSVVRAATWAHKSWTRVS